MSTRKKIFLFSDGTGNSASKLAKSNVWRIYEALDKSKPNQIAIYDNGVGTSSFRPLMLIGGAFGFGLKQNVLELYEFLCRHYNEGDQVYLIGFSRGAFTMRLLAGLIGSQGIIRIGFEKGQVRPENLGHYSRLAYQRLTKAFPIRGNYLIGGLRRLRSAYSWVKTKQLGLASFDEIERHRQNVEVPVSPLAEPEIAQEGSEKHEPSKNERQALITFMGLFDTVSAYGGPIKELNTTFSWLFWPSKPTDWFIGDYVKKVCHALALDDTRQSFRPKLISEAKPDNWSDPTKEPEIEDTNRIEQVWFSGAHSNVGGGYHNDGLSMIPLHWMIKQLQKRGRGVQFNPDRLEAIDSAQNCCAPIHDPRSGLGQVYRYGPRSLLALTEDFENNVYVRTPKIHKSVLDRIFENPGYAPIAINKPFEVVDDNGDTLSEQQSPRYTLKPEFNGDTENDAEKLQGDRFQPINGRNLFNGPIEAAWDKVWWRRALYVTQLVVVLGLLLVVTSEYFARAASGSVLAKCEQWHCFLQTPLEAIINYLPINADLWITLLRDNMDVILALLGISLFLLVWGRKTERDVRYSLSDHWSTIREKRSTSHKSNGKSAIYGFRTNRFILNIHNFMKNWVLPFFWGYLLVTYSLFFLNQSALYVADKTFPSMPICQISESGSPKSNVIDTRKLCNDLNFSVKAGKTYTVAIRPVESCGSIQHGDEYVWRDSYVPADPTGANPEIIGQNSEGLALSTQLQLIKSAAYYSFLGWMMREPDKKPFESIIQIGENHPTYPKLKKFVRSWSEKRGYEWSTRFRTDVDGKVYFYVNDLTLGGIGPQADFFYNDNCGMAEVDIKAE